MQAVVGDHSGSTMADLFGERNCPLGLLQRRVEIHFQHQHHAQHGQIRRFDTRKATRRAKLNTAREHLPRRAEQAAHIIGVSEAAERTRLLFHRARCLRLAQGFAVLGEAARHLATREMNVAAQCMNARLLDEQAPLFRLALSPVEECHRLLEAIKHRKTIGQPQKRAQSRPPGRRRIRRHAEGRYGLLGSPEALRQLARKIGQANAGGIGAGQRQAAPDQGQGLLGAIVRRGGFRRGKISFGRPGIFGHVEMLGLQRRVALAIPIGSGTVQLAPARLQERGIHALAHQGMNEGEAGAVLAQELLIDQVAGLVSRIAKQMTQRRQRYPLAQDRGGLQSPLLGCGQAIGTAEYETLHRRRHGAGGDLAGMAQQLLEEERVAPGPFDASRDSFIAAAQKVGGELR